MDWLTNDIIFYGGIIFAGIALLLAITSIFIFTIKKINLNARLDAEYGKYIEKTHKDTMTASNKEE